MYINAKHKKKENLKKESLKPNINYICIFICASDLLFKLHFGILKIKKRFFLSQNHLSI